MKKPITMMMLCLITLTPNLLAQQPLTLDDALDKVRSRTDIKAMMAGRLSLAESEVAMQGRWDNPQLLVSSEENKEADQTVSERYLLVSQRIELFGLRGLRSRSAQHQKNAVALENQSELLEIDALVKEQFFEMLFLKNKLIILQDWATEAAGAEHIIAQREKAGEISGYHKRRLQRDQALARTMIAREQARLAAHGEKLRQILAMDQTPVPNGTLLPDPTPVSDSDHPLLLALDENIKAADLDEKAAEKWVLPEITLEAGFKSTQASGLDDQGIFLSASVPLPVFNRKQPERSKARALAMQASGEQDWARTKMASNRAALRLQMAQLRASLQVFRQEGIVSSQELLEIAKLAYKEGELEILALLDAFGTLRDSQLEALAMEADIRRLTSELEFLGGGK